VLYRHTLDANCTGVAPTQTRLSLTSMADRTETDPAVTAKVRLRRFRGTTRRISEFTTGIHSGTPPRLVIHSPTATRGIRAGGATPAFPSCGSLAKGRRDARGLTFLSFGTRRRIIGDSSLRRSWQVGRGRGFGPAFC